MKKSLVLVRNSGLVFCHYKFPPRSNGRQAHPRVVRRVLELRSIFGFENGIRRTVCCFTNIRRRKWHSNIHRFS